MKAIWCLWLFSVRANSLVSSVVLSRMVLVLEPHKGGWLAPWGMFQARHGFRQNLNYIIFFFFCGEASRRLNTGQKAKMRFH